MESVLESIELLLLISALVSMLARKIKIPYTVGLVVAGLSFGIFSDVQHIQLSKNLIFSAFLPPLIFEAAFYIEWQELKKDFLPTLTLATLGLLFSAMITAVGMYYIVGWDLPTALLFGAMICATDPVSVIATFKDAGVHGRLRLLVESESLLNDGIAAVLFGLILMYVSGHDVSASSIGIDLLREVGGGIFIGFMVGSLILWIAGKTEDHLIEITFTTIAAYGSFLIAQKFHCSGVLSTLVCGLILGNLGTSGALSENGRDAVNSFWEYIAFVANSLIFLLIGGQIAHEHFIGLLIPILCAFIISTTSRAIPVYLLSCLFRKSSLAIDIKHQHVLVWGGLRGALSLALALGLPVEMEGRNLIVAVTFGTVALSILSQGITMPILLRRLGLIT